MVFELEPGEKQLRRLDVQLVEDGRTYPATLHLTSHRMVLSYAKTPRPWVWIYAWFIALIAKVAAHANEKVRYQIRRDRFASVEQGEGRVIVFHDNGEGYGHTSFAVTSSDPLATWQDRMHRWVNGVDETAAPLPDARVVDRG